MLTELAVTRPFAFISPKAMKNGTTKDEVTSFVGSGPWILKKHVIDEYAICERNENYWGKKPAFRRIIVKVVPDNQTRILALEKGEADLIWGKNMVDSDAFNKYRNSQKFGIAVSDPTSTRRIVLNTNRKHLSEPLVRKALQHATYKKTISQGIFHGFEPPADTLYAPTLSYCNIGLKPYEYDMKKAADLLAQAGYSRQSKRAPLTKNGNKLELKWQLFF